MIFLSMRFIYPPPYFQKRKISFGLVAVAPNNFVTILETGVWAVTTGNFKLMINDLILFFFLFSWLINKKCQQHL